MLGLKFRNSCGRALTSPDPLKKGKLQTNYCLLLLLFYSQGVDGMEVINAKFDFCGRDGVTVTVKKSTTVQWLASRQTFCFLSCCYFCFCHVQTSL